MHAPRFPRRAKPGSRITRDPATNLQTRAYPGPALTTTTPFKTPRPGAAQHDHSRAPLESPVRTVRRLSAGPQYPQDEGLFLVDGTRAGHAGVVLESPHDESTGGAAIDESTCSTVRERSGDRLESRSVQFGTGIAIADAAGMDVAAGEPAIADDETGLAH